ncbi:WD40 repeat domain-containing protein [Gemmata sp.]|uniref:WD40 repeat domain-containing protein n=1 Tax=Gemmata sp. TaxID=1914242 RepID=UPI003F6E9C3F
MRPAVVLVLVAWNPFPVAAAEPPARWQVRHAITLEKPATALAVGKTWAATGDADGTVRVWSLDNGKELAKLTPPGKPGAIRALAGPADGTELFGIEGERRGFLWDWPKPNGSRYVRHAFDGFLLDVAPDGKRWAVFDDEVRLESKNLAATVATPRLATVLVTTGEFRDAFAAQVKTDPFRVRCQFPPDGKGFACFVAPALLPRKVAWDEDDGLDASRRLRRWDDRGEVSYVASESPQFVAFSPDGKLAFSIGTRGEEYGQDRNLTGRIFSSTQVVDDGVRHGMILAEVRAFAPARPNEG